MKRLSLIPLSLFILTCLFFGLRLVLMSEGRMPQDIQTVMINSPLPEFSLPTLFQEEKRLNSSELKGKITLVNFFASWCQSCRFEHSLLSTLKDKIYIIGIAYKDKPNDTQNWLNQLGNPYDLIVFDLSGRTAIDFGLYGVPETYLIDQEGKIRQVWKKPLTEQDIRFTLLPLVKELKS
jgi:DsbE subfamily thiol:disulfide oxidoreductase